MADIVIVGTGFAGIKLFSKLTALKNDKKVILVGESPFLYVAPTGLRAIIDQSWLKRTLLPIEDVKGVNSKNFIHGRAVRIDPDDSTLHLEDGKVLSFKYCILATGLGQTELGRRGEGNVDKASILDHLETLNRKIKNASKIAIAGGGPNGLELAGEIKEAFPEKEVNLLHSRGKFLSSNVNPVPDRLLAQLEHKVRSIGINIYFNTRVKIPWQDNCSCAADKLAVELKDEKERTISVENGTKEINDIDLILVSINRMIPKDSSDSNPLYDSLPELGKAQQGQIQVNEYLQVPGFTKNNIYALGDAASSGAQKFIMSIDEQANVISKNIASQIKGENPSTQYKASSAPNAMIIPLGTKRGWGYFGSMGFFEFVVKFAKGNNLLGDMVWSQSSKSGKMPNLST